MVNMKIGDIIIKKEAKEPIPSDNYLSNGKYPIISQDSDRFISGYTNENDPITALPVILFGDHTCILKYVDFPFYRGADGTQLIYINESFNEKYIYYYLKAIIEQIPAYGKYERHFKYLKDLPLPQIELKTQYIIAELLWSLDNKISVNNSIIETSEKLMREIYDYWFVQFDFPDENGRPYKSSGGEMVYDEKLKREIPKGWKAIELGDIIKEAKKSSVQVNGAREKVGAYPFFTSGDEILDFDEYYVDGFNIFLNTGGNADIKSYYGKSAYSTDTWCISADKYSYILFIFLDSIKEQINNNCFAGSGLKHLQKNAFKKIKIVAPEDNLLRTFNDLAQSSYQAISSYKTENKKLASIRDWLLPMLMNGQIKISD